MDSHTVDDILIDAIIIMDTKGARLFAKYYSPPHHTGLDTSNGPAKSFHNSLELQHQLEQSLTQKANRQKYQNEPDVIQVDGCVAIYQQFENIRVFVLMSSHENELIAATILSTVTQCLELLFDRRVNKENLQQSLDLVMITIDEAIDDGMVLELDSQELFHRVSMREAHSHRASGGDDTNSMLMGGGSGHLPGQQQEHTLSSALGMATSALWRSFRSG